MQQALARGCINACQTHVCHLPIACLGISSANPADSSSERFIAELLAEEEAAAKQKEKKQAKAAKKKVGLGGWVPGSPGLGTLAGKPVWWPPRTMYCNSSLLPDWSLFAFCYIRVGKKSLLTTENDSGSIRDCGRQRFPVALTCRCCAVLYSPAEEGRQRGAQRASLRSIGCHL